MIFPLCAAVALSIWVMGNWREAKKVYPVFAPYSTRKRGIIPIYQAAAKNCLIKPEHTQMGQS